jgi:hypothetical protein
VEPVEQVVALEVLKLHLLEHPELSDKLAMRRSTAK